VTIPPRFMMAVWLAGWAAATALSLSITKPMRAPIHVDEVYWIGSAYYYDLAFRQRDWSHPDWKQFSARENPPVAKYLIGARLALAGQRVVNREMIACFRLMFQVPNEKFQAFEGRDLMLKEQGALTLAECARAPQGGPGVTRKRDLLPLSRHTLVACAIVASLVMFLFGAAIADRATGLVASQLLLLHEVVVEAYSHAMADGVAMMFSIAGAYAAWEFHRRLADDAPLSRRRATFLVLLNGVLLALACGSKMNSLVVVFLFGAGALAAAVLAWKRRDMARVRQTVGLAAATGVLAIAVFSLINPAVMIEPLAGLPALVTYQNLGLRFMMDIMADRALVTLPAKFVAVSQVASGPVGFVLIAAFSWLAALRRPRHGVWFAAAWWAIAFAVVTVWIPFQWPRYVLPVVLPLVLFLAYAVTSSATMLIEAFRPKRSSLVAPR
jgi:hypothetical protein